MGVVSIYRFMTAHQFPQQRTLDLLNEIKLVGDDKVRKRHLKAQLYAFTPSVIVKAGLGRKYENIKEFTGFAQLDFDNLPSVTYAEDFKQYLFNEYPMVRTAYLSPSRNGVKALIQIPKIDMAQGYSMAVKEYKDYYRAIASEFGTYAGFDDSPKNAILPLFLSVDKGILYREFVEVLWTKKEVHIATPNFNKDYVHQDSQSNDYHYNKTVRITETKIFNIVDSGHPQVLNTALVLGSRVGAGYIDLSDAERLIIDLIKGSSYLAKGVDGYIKTAIWAIAQGMKNPKNY